MRTRGRAVGIYISRRVRAATSGFEEIGAWLREQRIFQKRRELPQIFLNRDRGARKVARAIFVDQDNAAGRDHRIQRFEHRARRLIEIDVEIEQRDFDSGIGFRPLGRRRADVAIDDFAKS